MKLATLVAVLFVAGPAIGLPASAAANNVVRLTRADYLDRVQAAWTAQMIAVFLGFPFEHQVASTVWIDQFPRKYEHAIVDDDWYYEMCALRAFEKHGIGLTVGQLGEQWLENNCGSWGSSEQARLLLQRGVKAPDTGHPRYNKLWFTIGPQFSGDIYGLLAPGMPNLAGRLARDFGHVNGYAEGVDGAVFMAGMVSLGFVERDAKEIVRQAARLIHPDSPYRKCLDMVIAMAEAGESPQEIADAVEDRWHIEYPATNNAVANGAIAAIGVWFGEGDFMKTVNAIFHAADFTDADCNAANAGAVVGAMRGMKGLPSHLVQPLSDRIKGDKMGGVTLTPPVEESISGLAKRTIAVGERFLTKHGATLRDESIEFPVQQVATQPAELFDLAELTQHWNPDWHLERAGFGGAGGGMAGIRGITHLDGDVLATYPRDEVRGVVLRHTTTLGEKPALSFQAGVDAGRAWELNVYANNKLLEKRVVEGGTEGRRWQDMRVDLSAFARETVQLRLYQRVLVANRIPGNAYWRGIKVE